MKKVLLTIAIASLGISASAQDPEGFFDGWYFGVKGGASLTIGETSYKDLISPRAALDLGYQFSPVFGLRGELSGWQGKGALPKYPELYKFNFGQLNLDATFDLCNLFGDYKYDRLINPYLFAGIGGNYRFNNDEAMAIASKFPAENYLWDSNTLSFTGRFGIGADIRLSDLVAIELEVADNLLSDHFNSKIGDTKVEFDYQYTALAGLKFSFGAAKKRAAAKVAAAEAAAAKAAAEKAAAEKAAAEKAAAEKAAAEKAAAEKAAAEKAAAEKAAKDAALATVENIYFVIDETNITDDEQKKVDHIIAIMKQYPEASVMISGYADKNTGNAKRNMTLSEKRAAVVTEALVNAGISADRISSEYFGDTKQVSETPEKNRVAVCVMH